MRNARNGAIIYSIYAFSSKIKSMDTNSKTNTEVPVRAPYGTFVLKIRYASQNADFREKFLFVLIFITAFPLLLSLSFFLLPIDYSPLLKDIPRLIISTIAEIVLPIVILIAYFSCKRRRVLELKDCQKIIANGQKVTGVIKKVIKEINYDTYISPSNQYFFEVEFMNPISHKMETFKTPQLASESIARDSELPLTATVYVDEESIYVDQILDMPKEEPSKSKQLEAWLFFGAFVLIIIILVSIYLKLYILTGIAFAAFAAISIIREMKGMTS